MGHRNGLLFVDDNMYSIPNWIGVKCIHDGKFTLQTKYSDLTYKRN